MISRKLTKCVPDPRSAPFVGRGRVLGFQLDTSLDLMEKIMDFPAV